MKVNTPSESIANSVPETAKVNDELVSNVSTSVTFTVPIAVWFSSALKVALEVMVGATSSISETLIVMSCVDELLAPSLTVIVAV